MRLILDEHYSARIAVELRKRGHDAIAVTEVGALRQIADEDLLRWAGAERRVLVTEDASDLLPIHARLVSSGESHQGIVLTSHRRFPTSSAGIGSLVAALDELLTSAGGHGGHSQVRWLSSRLGAARTPATTNAESTHLPTVGSRNAPIATSPAKRIQRVIGTSRIRRPQSGATI